MISTAIATIISEMNGMNSSIAYQLDQAAGYHQKESEYANCAKSAENKAKEYELKLEGLQLKLREALNTEPSSVPIEPPKEPVDQIGREG